ncbi:Lrp/AsnC family transcriptional regulator [Pelagibacterium lentulum]|uniref:AsnC family transcriptional regulator n=1 Tax=Pelagibacterium lentulum TaxID=2029865 RepID=A0A916RBM7_9HYPH|nr:Lrp/AsnC family transcriptional regulator [Pelagibacterium lentulum]GGA49212.1 AsnC family transcriptional regulator [Pelagibacterium lentulum]
MMRNELDRLDISILEALQENARMPLSEVGRRIGLSQPATSERVKRLEERGAISGYGARLDAAALGLGMMAIIRVKTIHEQIQPALRAFADMPHVIEVHRMTGEDCFLLKVLVPTPEQLESIVDTIARFGAVTTSLVLRSEPVKGLGKALLG